MTVSLIALSLFATAPAEPNSQMKRVLEQLASYKAPPLPSLPADQARQEPGPDYAVAELLAKDGKPSVDPGVSVTHTTIPGPGGKLLARIYRPAGSSGTLPTAVYFHGGGWVIAGLNGYDASCRALAKQAGCQIVSVAYRMAPEHKFPAAHEDAYAAFQYLARNAASIRADSRRLAVVGESAGGNLAAAVCLMAKQRKGRMPIAQVLVYPIANYGFNTPSYRENANAKPLDRPMMQWFFRQYLRSAADGRSPYISLIFVPRSQLSGLPTATVILAEIDPLRSEGESYATHLKAAGVRTTSTIYRGVTHEFFGMSAVVDDAQRAVQEAADALKTAFRQ